ncbi:hypothetical protein RUND412_007715 [Rhizina undulata]
MPAPDSPTLLVARFLKSNGYDKTLSAFLLETGLDQSALDADTSGLTIEKVLEEKKLFDISQALEKIEIVDGDKEFSVPFPSIPYSISDSYSPPANVLFVTVSPLSDFKNPVIIAATVDRALRLFDSEQPHKLLRTYHHLHDAIILHCAIIRNKWLLTTSMTGRTVISNADTGKIVDDIHDHSKYVFRAIVSKNEEYVATAGYDKLVHVYKLTFSPSEEDEESPALSESVGKLELITAPEAIMFTTVDTADGKKDALIVSRRDSTFLYYHLLAPGLPLHTKYNLSPDANTWSIYHAMSLAPHPNNPDLIAVATSSVPHMKFLLVKNDSDEIVKEYFTGAEQSVYSTAVLAWRPEGSGVWVNADDGVVRGIEVMSGKVKARLKVCERGEKVRHLWAGVVEGVGECLVTGGFDKGLKLWRVGE